MMLAAIVEQNHKLRAKIARLERQLKTFRYPQVYVINMSIWLAVGLLLGYLLFGGK